jgi:hypothetical protein
MALPPKINLDYATRSVEHDAERLAAEHRKHVEDYNEATFGERRPFIATFFRLFVFMATVTLLIFLLPRSAGRPMVWLAVVAFFLWERFCSR